jgi:hypothetical protein
VIASDLKDTLCTGGNDCSAWNFRVGAQLTLHAPVGESKVWGGPLLGWEEQRYKVTGTGGSLEVKYRGLEGGLQGGVDLPTSGAFRWGPFASATVAEFQSAGLTGSVSGLEPLSDKSPHYRFTFGLRGVFGL